MWTGIQFYIQNTWKIHTYGNSKKLIITVHVGMHTKSLNFLMCYRLAYVGVIPTLWQEQLFYVKSSVVSPSFFYKLLSNSNNIRVTQGRKQSINTVISHVPLVHKSRFSFVAYKLLSLKLIFIVILFGVEDQQQLVPYFRI